MKCIALIVVLFAVHAFAGPLSSYDYADRLAKAKSQAIKQAQGGLLNGLLPCKGCKEQSKGYGSGSGSDSSPEDDASGSESSGSESSSNESGSGNKGGKSSSNDSSGDVEKGNGYGRQRGGKGYQTATQASAHRNNHAKYNYGQQVASQHARSQD